jgi:transposase
MVTFWEVWNPSEKMVPAFGGFMSDNVTRRFDREFKVGAVKMVVEGGRSVADVSQSLGVSDGALYAWVKQFKADGGDAFPGSGRLVQSKGFASSPIERVCV